MTSVDYFTASDATTKLKSIMVSYGLKPKDLSEMTYHSMSRVYHWTSGKHRAIPRLVLEFIELKAPIYKNAKDQTKN